MESKERISNVETSLRLFEPAFWLEYLCLVKMRDAPWLSYDYASQLNKYLVSVLLGV